MMTMCLIADVGHGPAHVVSNDPASPAASPRLPASWGPDPPPSSGELGEELVPQARSKVEAQTKSEARIASSFARCDERVDESQRFRADRTLGAPRRSTPPLPPPTPTAAASARERTRTLSP